MRRLFRLVLWLGFLAAAGYAVSRLLRSQSTLEQPTGAGWVPQASPPRQPVALKVDPPAEASPVEAPVVATEENAPAEPAPAKKAPAKKKAAAKKTAPKKSPPSKS